jgi:hypothetical protein
MTTSADEKAQMILTRIDRGTPNLQASTCPALARFSAPSSCDGLYHVPSKENWLADRLLRRYSRHSNQVSPAKLMIGLIAIKAAAQARRLQIWSANGLLLVIVERPIEAWESLEEALASKRAT